MSGNWRVALRYWPATHVVIDIVLRWNVVGAHTWVCIVSIGLIELGSDWLYNSSIIEGSYVVHRLIGIGLLAVQKTRPCRPLRAGYRGMNLEEARDADRDSRVGLGGDGRPNEADVTHSADDCDRCTQARSTSPSCSISHESLIFEPIHFSPHPNFSINLYYFSLYLAPFFSLTNMFFN